MLYHISEESGISRFEPRVPANGGEAVVWAVSGERLRNYLLPRECPRVTFFAGEKTTPADRERLLGTSEAVVAIESAWLDRVRQARLFCYQFADAGFTCVDQCAGYFQSVSAVEPVGVEVIDDCLAAIAARGVEIRVMSSLWDLHDAMVESTVSYSMIRMRNASPRGSE